MSSTSTNQSANPVAEVDGISIPGVQPNVVAVVGTDWHPPVHVHIGHGIAPGVVHGSGGGVVYRNGDGQGIGRGLGTVRFESGYKGRGFFHYQLPGPGSNYMILRGVYPQAHEEANQQDANPHNKN